MSNRYEAVDLFAGPGGWDEGALQYLNYHSILGIEFEKNACKTREAAGHATLGPGDAGDVSKLDPLEVAEQYGVDGRFKGMIASPPCQDFSPAGLRKGLEGVRGKLIYEVMRWATALKPDWIACEQVKEVLPIWKAFAGELSDMGYSVWYGILNAADYGVPQTRRRAILMASRTPFAAPIPTHAQNPSDDLFGGETLPWITMAEALGWGLTARPSTAVVARGHNDDGKPTGGSRPLDGGSGARQVYSDAKESGQFIVNTRGDRQTPGGNEFPANQPSWALTEKARSWQRRPALDPEGSSPDQQAAGLEQLAPASSARASQMSDSCQECGNDDSLEGFAYCSDCLPIMEEWKLRNGSEKAARSDHHDLDKPAPVVAFGHDADGWAWERPSTTIVGSFRPDIVAAPGWRTEPDEPRQKADGSVPILLWEGAVLQGFRKDYPWQGSKTRAFEQLGNAVPPPLAAAILAALGVSGQ